MLKILKWAVYAGAGVITILFLLVFYVSSKVKSEFMKKFCVRGFVGLSAMCGGCF